ncbi:DinB family protein [Maribacter sp. 2210JD10-5]|uniref:DinB family protein n=1 Tax=Maribacter sp. 2210JD10-5 TaxID=3386272 RepID=UPI0039BD724E
MKPIALIFIILIHFNMSAQEKNLPLDYYATIPEAASEITPGTIMSRMIDGLGFRYYWATEGLTETDLQYGPSEGARTMAQTLEHLYGLSKTIVNTAKKEPTDFTVEKVEMTFPEKRAATLANFKEASRFYAASEDLSEHKITFIRPKGTYEFPFWNQINGPIEDAVWHAGQIVLMRRASGNPINPNVNVFSGKLND